MGYYSFRRITNIAPIVDEITETEAKERKFISQFHEFNVQLELTPEERAIYESLTETINSHIIGHCCAGQLKITAIILFI